MDLGPEVVGPLDVCRGIELGFAGCSSGMVGDVITTVLIAAFLAVVWRPAVRWWKGHGTKREFDIETAERICELVRVDWIEPGLQKAITGQKFDISSAPAADLVELDKSDPPIRKRVSKLEALILQTRGRLLITGAPGSGKTVKAMEVAKLLSERFTSNPSEPVPIVLSVSSWNSASAEGFAVWLGAQMERCYAVDAADAIRWFEQGRFALILDGLDELFPSTERKVFLEKLNLELVKRPKICVVLTCRTTDLPNDVRARFRHAVCLLPLSSAQLNNCLEKLATESLVWAQATTTLRSNSAAMKVLGTPLYLDLLVGSQPEALAKVGTANSLEQAEQEVAKVFTDEALKKLGDHLGPSFQWAAKQLDGVSDSDRSVLYVDDLVHPLLKRRPRLTGWLVAGSVPGVFVGLYLAILRDPVVGLFVGSFVAICASAVFGKCLRPRSSAVLSTFEPRFLGWRLAAGLAVGLWTGVATRPPEPLTAKTEMPAIVWSTTNVGFWVSVGLTCGLLAGVSRQVQRSPNPKNAARHAWRSLVVHLFVPLAVFPISTVFWFSNSTITETPLTYGRDYVAEELIGGVFFAIVFGLLSSLPRGGYFLVNKFLWSREFKRKNLFPGGLVALLDRAAGARGIVRRVGPGWQFRHRAIQDYLATAVFVDDAVRSNEAIATPLLPQSPTQTIS
jgi:NACHT domain